MPTDLPEHIPGAWLVAAMEAHHVTEEELAALLPPTHPMTISRWRRAGTDKAGVAKGIPAVAWYACLMALDLPKDWRPPGEKRGRR